MRKLEQAAQRERQDHAGERFCAFLGCECFRSSHEYEAIDMYHLDGDGYMIGCHEHKSASKDKRFEWCSLHKWLWLSYIKFKWNVPAYFLLDDAAADLLYFLEVDEIAYRSSGVKRMTRSRRPDGYVAANDTELIILLKKSDLHPVIEGGQNE